ncbi:MAG: RNA polymerase-associated protein RapA [Alcanivoracaceae bacterium]|nr:RNA polymerase-associated protein RapA [Alcanivoracaceae bacterium]
MTDFALGQRWLSETETELGLGIIQDLAYRLVTVYFPACEEERTYARDNAPLARMSFSVGDTITTAKGDSFIVAGVRDVEGILIYQACPEDDPSAMQLVPESQLGHQLDLRTASDRLFAGQLDTSGWFNLRYAAMQAQDQLIRSPVRGLMGPRVDLIGHQLHIAHEVGHRFAPRVLLADEVGLGKTIEAGMILHQQLRSHRAERVLIVVPPALVHQWFVEMVRRFNLHFSIFDASRLESLRHEYMPARAEEDELLETVMPNPFQSEQLVLISSDFLLQCNSEELVSAGWDLLVIDEAHHLEWSPDHASEAYRRAEQLAYASRGVLLLTATPEQLGRESHYARLRLLDPDRYPSLEQFIDEQDHYRVVAELAAALHDQPVWPASLKEQAAEYVSDVAIEEKNRELILRELIDRSGTGRVMFRNTRKHVQGFPARVANLVPLPCPSDYIAQPDDTLEDRLFPERLFSDDRWCEIDSRASWLVEFLRKQRRDKVLVICARSETASDLQAWLNYKHGFNVGVFHEHMDLIARDRAAAWFAESEDGAQALVCSEIGSEGRNFQFAHHLVLFDLPRNPDLLEQRIGRLDRIGQQQDIQIHLPHFSGQAQQVLLRWYHEGMDAFSQPNAAGSIISTETGELLEQALMAPADDSLSERLIEQTREASSRARELLESGRDRLLELSSFDPDRAATLVGQLAEADQHSPITFMEQVFERYGVEQEDHSRDAWILQPSPQMIAGFPGLPDDGITVTDQRNIALARDDMHFLSWEHPLVEGAIDLVLGDDHGKACVTLLKNKRIPAGTLLLEGLYRIEVQAPKSLQAERFLPVSMMRVLLDARGKDLSATIAHEALSKQCHKLDKALARKIVASQKEVLDKLLRDGEDIVQSRIEALIQEALTNQQNEQQQELLRLRDLMRRNPAIPEEELAFLIQLGEILQGSLQQAHCQLAAIRLIVVGHD